MDLVEVEVITEAVGLDETDKNWSRSERDPAVAGKLEIKEHLKGCSFCESLFLIKKHRRNGQCFLFINASLFALASLHLQRDECVGAKRQVEDAWQGLRRGS